MRKHRFAFVVGFAALSSVGLVVTIGSGAGCTFDKQPDQPDTFVPDPDVSNDSSLVQPPVTVFDPVSGTDLDPDYSCRGRVWDAGAATDAPYEVGADGAVPGGEMIDVGLKVYSFGTGNTEVIAGVSLDVFFGDAIAGHTPDLAGVLADAAGIAHIQAPAGARIAYRIAAKDDPDPKKGVVGFQEYDLQLPWFPGQNVEAAGVTTAESATLKLAITGDASYVPAANTAIFATRIVDCNRHNTRNATLDLIDLDNGNAPVGPYGDCKTGAVCRIYMSDAEFPELSAPWSSRSGLVVIANLDASHHYRAVAKGKEKGSPDLSTVGARDVEVAAGTIDVEYIYP